MNNPSKTYTLESACGDTLRVTLESNGVRIELIDDKGNVLASYKGSPEDLKSLTK